MGYVIHYDICALVIYAITGVVFYFKKRIPCSKNKVFGILVGDSALSTVLDILSVLSTGEWGIGLKPSSIRLIILHIILFRFYL